MHFNLNVLFLSFSKFIYITVVKMTIFFVSNIIISTYIACIYTRCSNIKLYPYFTDVVK